MSKEPLFIPKEDMLVEIQQVLETHYKDGIFYPIVDAVEAIIKVLNKGAEKYTANGWVDGVKFNPKDNAASKNRHTMSDSLGQTIDPDSGLMHLENDVTRGAMALISRKRGWGHFNKNLPSLFDEQNI